VHAKEKTRKKKRKKKEKTLNLLGRGEGDTLRFVKKKKKGEICMISGISQREGKKSTWSASRNNLFVCN